MLELNFIEIDYKKHFKNIKEFEQILLKTEFNELLGIIESKLEDVIKEKEVIC